MDDYWDQIRITEAMLRLHEPTTAQGVIDVLHQYDPHGPGSVGDAFYSAPTPTTPSPARWPMPDGP